MVNLNLPEQKVSYRKLTSERKYSHWSDHLRLGTTLL